MALYSTSKYNKMEWGVRQLDQGYCLRFESARKLLHAERFARSQGAPFTHALTLSFTGPCVPGMTPEKLFKLIRNNLQAAWNRRRRKGQVKGALLYSAVFENPPYRRYFGQIIYGPLHVHCMIRWVGLPDGIAEQIANRAIRKYLAGFVPQRVNLKRLYSSVGYAMYQAKGIDPPYAKHFKLQHRPQGPIPFKRIVICNALGKRARARYRSETGLDPFHHANLQRRPLTTNGPKRRRRNKLSKLKPWAQRSTLSAGTMAKIAPQHPGRDLK